MIGPFRKCYTLKLRGKRKINQTNLRSYSCFDSLHKQISRYIPTNLYRSPRRRARPTLSSCNRNSDIYLAPFVWYPLNFLEWYHAPGIRTALRWPIPNHVDYPLEILQLIISSELRQVTIVLYISIAFKVLKKELLKRSFKELEKWEIVNIRSSGEDVKRD